MWILIWHTCVVGHMTKIPCIKADSNGSSANLNVEVQKRTLTASQEAAFYILINEWYDEGKSDAVKVSPVQSDLRRVEYSAEMAEIGFPP